MTSPRFSAAPCALLLVLALPGCADVRTGYPSLAPRPIERVAMEVPAAPATAPVTPAPLPASADLVQIIASVQAADSAFKAALEQARPKVEGARGAAEGSEAWVASQQALSNAEAQRAPVATALAELDKRREAAVAAGNGSEEAALMDAALQIQALDEAERAQLAGLMPG